MVKNVNKFVNKKKKRKVEYLDEIEKILIFSEGTRTEPNYFDSFKDRINKNAIFKDSVIVETYGLGTDTIRVVNNAKEYVDTYHIRNAHVWCVYDKDDFLDSDFNKADELCKKYTNDHIVFESAWSNQSIEYWFVLHFAYYTSDNDRLDYIAFLNRIYKEKKLGKYEKPDENTYLFLEKYGSPKQAIKNASKILTKHGSKKPSKCRPATKVHLLVQELAKYLPEKDKSLYLDD